MPIDISVHAGLSEPQWGALGEDVFRRTYSRKKADGSQETWAETCKRVVEGNCSFVDERFIELGEPEKLFDLLYNFKILPGGRHLWATGVKGASHVANCFAAETPVLTRDGWRPIGSLAGETALVVTDGGAWTEADFHSFGEQELMQVCYGRGGTQEYSVFATADHEWIVLRQDSKRKLVQKRVRTVDLKKDDRLPMVSGRFNGVYLSPQGVQHGIVFGDGTRNEHDTRVCLIGDSCIELLKYFPQNRQTEAVWVECQPAVTVSGLPSSYKDLPDVRENKPYLLGFLAGWIAADGHVKGNKGTVRLFNKSKDVLLRAKDIASVCGIRTTEPYLERRVNPYTGESSELYSISFYGFDSVEKVIVRSDHLQNFQSGKAPRKARTMRVRSVTPTDRKEEVYCAQVPGTHSFVIVGDVLTGNCWASGWTEDFADHFEFTFARLMEGGGVGANYSDPFLRPYRKIPNKIELHIVCDPDHPDYDRLKNMISHKYSSAWGGAYQIEDSREGWVSSLGLLLRSFYKFPEGFEFPDGDLVFDLSHIRAAGSPLKRFGGTASGPAPLAEMLLRVCLLMNTHVGKKPDSFLALDVDHEIARCVVAGNVRRCLPAGSMVHTDGGLIPIEFVQCGDLVLTSDGTYTPVSHTFDQGVQQTVRILTKTGEFVCTGNHKMAVLDTLSGDYSWAVASELSVGDRLVFVPQVLAGSDTKLPEFSYDKPSHSSTCQDITVPELDTGMAWFFGLFFGDGYVYPNYSRNGFNAYVSVACSPDLEDIVVAAEEQLGRFGVNVAIYRREQHDLCVKVNAQSKQLALYMAQFKTANESLCIPDFILRGSPEIRAAFVAGLFDSDGSVRNKPVCLCASVYPDFLRQLQSVYASLGIPARLKLSRPEKGKWKPLYWLTLVGRRSYRKFNRLVAPHAHKRLPDRSGTRNGLGYDNDMVRSCLENSVWKGKWDGTGQLNHDVFEDIIGEETAMLPVEVLGVEPGESLPTYDIEVDGKHEFVVNGLLTHNSARMSMKHWKDMEIERFIRMKEDGESHSTTNISVILDHHFWTALRRKDKHAKKIIRMVAEGCVLNGEPGIFNITKANEREPNKVVTSNPCGEIGLPEWGACLSASTLLDTPKGLISVAEMFARKDEGWEVNTLTESGLSVRAPVSKMVCNGKKPVFDVTLKNGQRITLTADHRVSTPSGWVEVKDLKAGSSVRIQDTASIAPDIVSDPLFELFGWMVGDGSYFDYAAGILWSADDQEAMNRLLPIWQAFTGKQLEIQTQPTGVRQVYDYSQETLQKFAAYGFTPGRATDKRVPKAVLTGTSAQQLSFLRGLFSADGTCFSRREKGRTACRLQLASSSLLMLEEVQLLLSRHGIQSNINWQHPKGRKNAQGVLSISGLSAKRYMELVGFLLSHKTKKFVPLNKKVFLNKEYQKVVSIGGAGTEIVYDLEVPGLHSMIAQGMLVHNCNLGSVNLRTFANDRTGALEAFRLTARFLLRATFADYLDPRAQAIIERDRRIGVGFTGFADWLALEGVRFSSFSTSEPHRDFLRQARKVVRNEAREYAFQLRIPEPVKVTTCAPTGSTSKLCGVSEGMQPVLFKYFKRRVSYSGRDPEHVKIVEKAIADGLDVEDSVYTEDTKVVSYPCRVRILDDPNIDESIVEEAADISLEEYLDAQKSVQDTFVDNSISFTLNIDSEKVSVEDLEKALASFGPHLKGTTVMPFVSNRPQMPYERISKEEFEESKNQFSSAGEWECKNNSCTLVVKTEEESNVLV